MRDIIFRGKDPDTGEWYYGSYYECKKTTYCVKEDYDRHPENTERYILFDRMMDWCLPNRHMKGDVIPETVGQYTGLKDKNGVEIYEGDILRAHNNPDDLTKVVFGEFYVIHMETEEAVDEVIGWHTEVIPTDALSQCEPFCFSMPLTEHYINLCEHEVIGNIYESPELLEGGKQK